MKAVMITLLLAASVWPEPAQANPVPVRLDSSGSDRAAIEALLATYTKAVSIKDQALFETLLLNKDIPFSDIGSAVGSGGAENGTRHYEAFRKDVFAGAPFIQHFQDIHIEQDGALAAVSLVFVNRSAEGTDWGWKTLQLLKVGGRWKIASEFYTGHPG